MRHLEILVPGAPDVSDSCDIIAPYDFSRIGSADLAEEKTVERALKIYRNLDGSAIMVNDHTAFRVDWMPFAGLKESGLGTGGIPYTIEDMQVKKMLVLHSVEL